MGKMIIKEKDLKGTKTIKYKDKDTKEVKGVSYACARGKIELSEKALKNNKIHILDKVVIVDEDNDDKEEEIGTVNDFYKEE